MSGELIRMMHRIEAHRNAIDPILSQGNNKNRRIEEKNNENRRIEEKSSVIWGPACMSVGRGFDAVT